MKRLLFLSLFVLLLKWSKEQECLDINEEYKCSIRCEEYCGQYPNYYCVPQENCSFGCYCKSGYIRKYRPDVGPCALASECPKCLGAFQEYRCARVYEEGYCGKEVNSTYVTPEKCRHGCYCSKGYVRRDGQDSGPCVPVSACPRCRGVFEEYKCSSCEDGICGERPDPRCDPQKKCLLGCYCKSGYVRKYYSSAAPCVPSSECPRCFGAFEEFKCSNVCEEGFCGSRRDYCNGLCTLGCYCLRGYVRRDRRGGPCIPASQCEIAGKTEN